MPTGPPPSTTRAAGPSGSSDRRNEARNDDLHSPPTRPRASRRRPTRGRRSAGAGGGLGRYLLVRFLLIFPTVFILVTMVFVLMRTTGDPITAVARRPAPRRPAGRADPRGRLRPADPRAVPRVPRRHRSAATSAPRSATTARSPRSLTTYGAATLELAFYALLVAFVVGIPLGRVAADHRDKAPDAVAAGLRDPLLRDARVLRRPAAQARLLGLARLAPGRRPRVHRHGDRAPAQRRGPTGHLPHRRDPHRQPGGRPRRARARGAARPSPSAC